MKKACLTLVSIAYSAFLMAQLPKNTVPIHPIDISNIKNIATKSSGPVKSSYAIQNFYVDYSLANFNDNFNAWTINSAYVNTDTVGGIITPITYVAQALTNPLAGYSNKENPTDSWLEEPYYYNPVTIDSVFAILSHENNSGEYNKITMQIVTLDESLAPTESVLWSQIDSTNTSLSPGGQWLGDGSAFIQAWAPAYTTTDMQKIGITLRYDAAKTDTFTLIGSSIKDSTGSVNVSQQSQYKNSWVKISYLNNTLLQNANIGYGIPEGAEGWFEAQNWSIYAYVTYNVTSITENEYIKGVKIGQSFPNPASGTTKFFYELQKPTNVSFQVTDMNGRLVKEYNEGTKTTGKHSHVIDLASFNNGVYFYTIKTDATTITKRFVVAN